MILHTIVVHDPGIVVAVGICPVRTCLVFILGEGVHVQELGGFICLITGYRCLVCHKYFSATQRGSNIFTLNLAHYYIQSVNRFYCIPE